MLGFGLLRGGRTETAVGAGLLAGVLALGTYAGGVLGFVLIGLFLLAGSAVVHGAKRLGVGVVGTLGAAAVGLLTHPFGDLFTGTPPSLLYPVGPDLVPERIVLHPDPTLNLLAVFALELASIWLGVLVAAHLYSVSVPALIERQAVLGIAYGAIALVLAPPTLEVAEPFVFSVLAVGVVGLRPLRNRVEWATVARGFATGLVAVTLGGLSYCVVYLAL